MLKISVKHLRISLITLFIAFSHLAMAQEDFDDGANSGSGDSEIEQLYDNEETKPKSKSKDEREESGKSTKQISTLSDLATLAPFEDVAVIQRRFLPKTGRFELSANGFTNLNNPFFNNLGVGLTASYYLREKYAVSLIGNIQSTTTRQATDDLESKKGIATDNIVGAEGFLGVALKWNPIYGKITWLNKSIVPFDLNFEVGLGVTRTTADQDEPTLHLASNQVFAWTKSMAFTWQIAWNMYQATITNLDGKEEVLNQNDLFLGVGMNFYFPEASYR